MATMTGDSREEGLNERAQRLLRVLVQSYIRDGQPVGSRSLSRESGLVLSSATVRNVMADLEELGFVTSPHTSAGRVPTDKAYRFFVDTLLRAHAPTDDASLEEIRRQLDAPAESNKSLAATASQLLSNITQLAGVVTLPPKQVSVLTHIEFLPLSENRILVVLVLDDREVQNRIIQLGRHYGAEELRRAANFLNEHCTGLALSQIRQELLRQLQETRESLNQVMLDAIQMAQRFFEEGQEAIEYVIAGETNLMGFAELSSVDKLKRLFEAFNEKRDMLHLLDQSLKAEGVQIFIGQESGYQILDDYSLVMAPYSSDKGVIGVLGVIGPTRMAYERVIPIVELTAKVLGAALNFRR
ncbi:MAG TPA: heat-inducible transcriptional repressor HrcA [Steroidobacteraceae bacterium]|jgi:heat-inducible transcriptional repressor|nr:heat-inducible transcriptional repressor HrcA [Steroidobacteraceae bacterium]